MEDILNATAKEIATEKAIPTREKLLLNSTDRLQVTLSKTDVIGAMHPVFTHLYATSGEEERSAMFFNDGLAKLENIVLF